MSAGNGDGKKVVFLGMPSGGNPAMGAAHGFLRAYFDSRGLAVEASYKEASLLNANCNGLWAWAMSAQRCGRRVDYFAMLHADICPSDHWLDPLVGELEARGLDVLSVAVPIKDSRGLTSTAIGHCGPQDYYRAHCRLTLAELYKLPETFTIEDLGLADDDRPLLVNTGCFVCKFDWRWAEKVVFQDRNRIRWDGIQYVVETFPEDWNFARQCFQLGLKVGCTRKVELTHRGPTEYGNGGVWGDLDFDREYLAEPFVKPPPPPQGWHFPHDVGGWLTEAEGRALAALAGGRRVLEVGSYLGRSTVCLARTAASVDAVDPFDGRATPEPRPCRGRFAENLRRHGVAERVTAHVGTFADVAPHLEPGYDLVFVDADHRYESVRADVALALPLLRDGGVLALHDYRRPRDEGVTRAVDEYLASSGAALLAVVDHLALIRPAASGEGRGPRQGDGAGGAPAETGGQPGQGDRQPAGAVVAEDQITVETVDRGDDEKTVGVGPAVGAADEAGVG